MKAEMCNSKKTEIFGLLNSYELLGFPVHYLDRGGLLIEKTLGYIHIYYSDYYIVRYGFYQSSPTTSAGTLRMFSEFNQARLYFEGCLREIYESTKNSA